MPTRVAAKQQQKYLNLEKMHWERHCNLINFRISEVLETKNVDSDISQHHNTMMPCSS
jgi:hypothetical protein